MNFADHSAKRGAFQRFRHSPQHFAPIPGSDVHDIPAQGGRYPMQEHAAHFANRLPVLNP